MGRLREAGQRGCGPCHRAAREEHFTGVETFWKALSLAEKDQLQSVSDAGLWTKSVGEHKSESVWIEELFAGS